MQTLKFNILLFILLMIIYPVSISAQIEHLDFSKDIKTEKTDSPIKENQDNNKITDSNALIHSGDLIDVDILGSTEFDWRGKVTPEGYISGLQFVENIYALCRTETVLADEIAKLYTKFLRNPKVKVRILDRSDRPVSSLRGAVKIPQRFQLNRPIYLNELIILSGGFTDGTNGNIQILRRTANSCSKPQNEKLITEGSEKTTEGKFIKVSQDDGLEIINIKVSNLLDGQKESNPEILYGDIITVSGAEPVYVIGGVNNPGQILFRSGLTVSRAVSIAGGLTKKADSEKVKVFRRDGTSNKIIEINLDSIKVNEKEDVLLEPYDIVDVGGKGDDRKYPPIIEFGNSDKTNNSKLPLRVID